MIASLSVNGRIAAVAPHGVLFRGAAEGRIRQKVIEENLLDAVIGLPENLLLRHLHSRLHFGVQKEPDQHGCTLY